MQPGEASLHLPTHRVLPRRPTAPSPQLRGSPGLADTGSILAGTGTVGSRGEGKRRGTRLCSQGDAAAKGLAARRCEARGQGPERQPWKQQHGLGTPQQEARGQEAAWLRNQNKYEGGHLEQAVLFTAELPGKQDGDKCVCDSVYIILIYRSLLPACGPRGTLRAAQMGTDTSPRGHAALWPHLRSQGRRVPAGLCPSPCWTSRDTLQGAGGSRWELESTGAAGE